MAVCIRCCSHSHQQLGLLLAMALIYTCVISVTATAAETSGSAKMSRVANPVFSGHHRSRVRQLHLCTESSVGGEADGTVPEIFHVPPAYKRTLGRQHLSFKLKSAGFKCKGPTDTLNFSSRPSLNSSSGDDIGHSQGAPAGNSTVPGPIPVLQSYAPSHDSSNMHPKESDRLMTPVTTELELEDPTPTTATAPPLQPEFFFTEDGFIVYGNDVYHPNEYCLTKNASHLTTGNEGTNSVYSITLCVPHCSRDGSTSEGNGIGTSSNKIICLNKCCPFGQSIDLGSQRCANSGPNAWNFQNAFSARAANAEPPTFYDTQDLAQIPIEQLTYHMSIARFPSNCPENWIRFPNFNREIYDEHGRMPNTEFRVLDDGRVLSFSEQRRKWYPITTAARLSASASASAMGGGENIGDDYQYLCLDGVQNFGESRFYSGRPKDDILIHCEEPIPIPTEPGREFYYGPVHILVLFLSSTFLLITAFVYYLTMKKDKGCGSVHGWTVLCQIISMFFTYIFLGTSHIFSLFSDLHLGTWPCILNGILSHFFTLSAFFWMTSLDFDIWKTFRSIKSCRQSKGKKSLVYYVLFAVGIPAIIIAISLGLEYTYQNTDPDFITPAYGRHTCYMSNAALGYYVYYIIGFLLSCNIILISLTFKNIYQARASTQTVLHKSRAMERQQSSARMMPASVTVFMELTFGYGFSFGYGTESLFKLFAKLLVVTGVTWILEVISWLFYEQIQACKTRHWIWLFFDTINYLQPVAIFVIFVCKRKTLYILATRFVVIRKMNPNWANTSKKSILSTPSSARQTSRRITNVTGVTTTSSSLRSPTPTYSKKEPLIALNFNGSNGCGLKKDKKSPPAIEDRV